MGLRGYLVNALLVFLDGLRMPPKKTETPRKREVREIKFKLSSHFYQNVNRSETFQFSPCCANVLHASTESSKYEHSFSCALVEMFSFCRAVLRALVLLRKKEQMSKNVGAPTYTHNITTTHGYNCPNICVFAFDRRVFLYNTISFRTHSGPKHAFSITASALR